MKNINPRENFTMTYQASLEVANKIEKTLVKEEVPFDTKQDKSITTLYHITVTVSIKNARSVNNQINNLLKNG